MACCDELWSRSPEVVAEFDSAVRLSCSVWLSAPCRQKVRSGYSGLSCPISQHKCVYERGQALNFTGIAENELTLYFKVHMFATIQQHGHWNTAMRLSCWVAYYCSPSICGLFRQYTSWLYTFSVDTCYFLVSRDHGLLRHYWDCIKNNSLIHHEQEICFYLFFLFYLSFFVAVAALRTSAEVGQHKYINCTLSLSLGWAALMLQEWVHTSWSRYKASAFNLSWNGDRHWLSSCWKEHITLHICEWDTQLLNVLVSTTYVECRYSDGRSAWNWPYRPSQISQLAIVAGKLTNFTSLHTN